MGGHNGEVWVEGGEDFIGEFEMALGVSRPAPHARRSDSDDFEITAVYRTPFQETGYHFQSREAWKEFWRDKGLNSKPHELMRTDGTERTADWVIGKEIRIERTPRINPQVVPYVINGINMMLSEVGLQGFRIRDFGADPLAQAEIRAATNSDGSLNSDKLRGILALEKARDEAHGGSPHADVVIIDKPLAPGRGEVNWGETTYREGAFLLSLIGNHQNQLEFITNISIHEAGHLLGYDTHHTEYKVRGYEDNTSCVMNWESSTRSLCNKCRDAIVAFWEGVEQRTGTRFLGPIDLD